MVVDNGKCTVFSTPRERFNPVTGSQYKRQEATFVLRDMIDYLVGQHLAQADSDAVKALLDKSTIADDWGKFVVNPYTKNGVDKLAINAETWADTRKKS